jgi:hypothetical protein
MILWSHAALAHIWKFFPETRVMAGLFGENRMGSIKDFSFHDQLVISTGTSANRAIGEILMGVIPGALRAIQALPVNDRQGVDWWIETKSGERVAIDCKIREDDPLPKYKKDDLALEVWSVVEKKVVGWSLDETKRTDYVFWLFKDTGRWCVVPFLMMVRAFKSRKDEWTASGSGYRVARQKTDNRYHSECVFVDRRQLWAEIYRQAAGHSEQLRVAQSEQLSLFAAGVTA